MDLFDAISSKNEKLALDIIERGTDVNFTIGENPVLMLAIQENLSNVANKLIDKKADINLKNSAGTTPVRYAAWRSMNQLVIRMIDLGADVELKNEFNACALEVILDAFMEDVKNHLKFMHLNNLLDTIHDESNILSKCFRNNGDLNILDMINDFLQVDYNNAYN